MSRLLLNSLAVISLCFSPGFSKAGEFISEGLVPAEILDMEAGEVADLAFEESTNVLMQHRPAPPPRRTPPPPRRSPRRDRMYHCYAENERRQVFTGRDRVSARLAQAEAMDACHAYSLRCRPLGCEYY